MKIIRALACRFLDLVPGEVFRAEQASCVRLMWENLQLAVRAGLIADVPTTLKRAASNVPGAA